MAQEFYKKFPILMTAPQFASTPLHRLFFHELWQLYDTLPSIEHDKLNQLLESFAKVLEGINFSQTEKTAYLLFMLLMPLGRSATNPSNITVYRRPGKNELVLNIKTILGVLISSATNYWYQLAEYGKLHQLPENPDNLIQEKEINQFSPSKKLLLLLLDRATHCFANLSRGRKKSQST